MKFCADGPEIPDDLLWRRDDGDVVFICGAGVSAQRAGLPGFDKLALKVMDNLRIPDDHNARKILRLSKKNKNRGLISIDRVFGEIEHDYYMPEIISAVTKVLSSKMRDDTSCHEIMRDLATAPDGKIRLITTNFDNLFSQVTSARPWIWPNLPNVAELKSLNGLVYLHGKCENEDSLACQGLVLSTSSFGEAYLSGGQARELLMSILERYTVVFVGYSADDPPMQYLLEALAKSEAPKKTAYAFYRGEQSEADRKWRHRGVTPLCYNDHRKLWETLEHWKGRANDFNSWANQIIEMAQSGPHVLADWQRSQVAHLVSHPTGAKIVAGSEVPIPPEWLFVFDPEFRYATPKKRSYIGDEREYSDPFDVLGLESDAVPRRISPNDDYAERKKPEDAWDAFRVSQDDALAAKGNEYFIPFRKLQHSNNVQLPERLWHLAVWVQKIAMQPMTFRWAVHQDSFHPSVKRQILYLLNFRYQHTSDVMHLAWEKLFEIWDMYEFECNEKLHILNRKVDQLGWNSSRISSYRNLLTPRLVARKLERVDELLCPKDMPDNVKDIMPLDIKYYGERCAFDTSDESVFDVLEADFDILKKAIEMEKKLNRYNHINLPIVSNKDFVSLDFPNNFGISLIFVRYYKRFMDAYSVSPNRCMDEFKTWPESDKNVFARLRILVAGNTRILTPSKAGNILASVPQDVFWNRYHMGDIANSIKSRWDEFSPTTRKKIEKRILEGDSRFDGEEDQSYEKHRAWYILDILNWLRDNGCIFDIDYVRTIQSLKQKCPTWSKSSSRELDRREEITVERGSLDNASLSKGGSMAEFYFSDTISESDRGNVSNEGIVEFIGMCEDKPGEAFKKLAVMARKGEYREWMWRFWFRSNQNDERCRLYLNRAAAFLCRASTRQIAKMKSSVYDWFSHVVENFQCSRYNLRYMLSIRLLEALKEHPGACSSEIIRMPGRRVEWISETANSPIGHFVDALCKYPDILNLGLDSKPPRHFIDVASGLLSLKDDGGRYALVSFAIRIPFIYSRFPTWTSVNVIEKIKHSDDTTKEAYFEGLSFASGTIRAQEIFLNIRDGLVAGFCDNIAMTENTADKLSWLILCGWLTKLNCKRLLSDTQFREALSQGSSLFREGVLWNLYRWVKNSSDSNGKKCREVRRFFSCIWPLGRFAVTQKTNRYMLEISFFNVQMFSLLNPVLEPRIIRAETFHINLGDLVNDKSKIVKRYPEVLLNILVHSLPEDPFKWHHDMGKVFDAVEKAAPHLKKNYEFLNLRRKCIF